MTAAMDLDAMVAGEELVDPVEAEREQWFRRRSGKFTCSRFGDLMATGRGKDDDFSQTGWGYIYQVAAERLGSYAFEFDSAPTRWGNEHELEAINTYIEQTAATDVTTGTSCFRQANDYIAGTPDGLVGALGCLEVKCPYTPQEHMKYVHQGVVPVKYFWQVHGHLLVTNRQWCDFISFDPRIDGPKRLLVIRTDRDDGLIGELRDKLAKAEALVQEIVGK